MERKGASLVFEQVLLFMIGVIIFIISMSIFRSYELYYTDTITREQLDEVSGMVASTLITFSGDPGINSTMRIAVPATLGNEHYSIRLSQAGLNLTTLVTGTQVFLPLSGINRTFDRMQGGFSTAHGSEFLIYKRGNQIIIG